jgi:aspartyl-tRNA(Asn)/glutamyl-tRNA(Gln) amidotransferase subunit A
MIPPALKQANAPLNAFADWDDAATFGPGPLEGLTVGVKANIAVAGLPWTAGMDLHRRRIATRDAEVVGRLRAAGAAIIGSLNMEEAALGAKTDNHWFGPTHNPHCIGNTPGGSSGGSGAAVAAGLCDIALGTDTLGSIRIPAAYCGVYGFKPATAAVSQDGLELCDGAHDAIGPLTRNLDLLEKVAAIISDFGACASDQPPAILENLAGVTCDAAVLSAYDRALTVRGASAQVTLPHPLARVRFAGFIASGRALSAALVDADESRLSPKLKRLMAYGPRRSAADWSEDQRVMAETGDALRAIVARHGVLLTPTTPGTAFPHSQDAPDTQADFTCIANIAGLPAISIPAGFSDEGLPVALQLIGAAGAERGLFALARTLDTSLAGYQRPAHYFEG